MCQLMDLSRSLFYPPRADRTGERLEDERMVCAIDQIVLRCYVAAIRDAFSRRVVGSFTRA
jgi:hypothetical protein